MLIPTPFHEYNSCCCITMMICWIRDKYFINVLWHHLCALTWR